MKDSKPKSKDSRKKFTQRPISSKRLPRHEAYAYGIMERGRIDGGMSNPILYSLSAAKAASTRFNRKAKVVKIRITHEVVAEVIV